MDQESMDKLLLDKRLRHRRGWIDPKQIDAALAALPDSADKVAAGKEESESEDAGS